MPETLPAPGHGRNIVAGQTSQFVTLVVAGQLFGLPALDVCDILSAQRIARIPLAPPEVAGALNLRGRIVTAIDLRRSIGLPPLVGEQNTSMNVVVDHEGELYSLITDSIGEVLDLSASECEPPPATMNPIWQKCASGIFRLETELMVVLDVSQLLKFETKPDALSS